MHWRDMIVILDALFDLKFFFYYSEIENFNSIV